MKAFFVLLLAGFSAAITKDELYSHGQNLDKFLPKEEEDSSSTEQPLTTSIKYFGEIYDSIYVNSNGLLSFLTEIPSFFNIQFPLDYPVIAPLYTNVDTRGSGDISFRETQDPLILMAVTNKIQRAFSSGKNFEAKSAFVATWKDVGYYNMGTDKVNTYQVVIATDGEETFVEFLYPQGGIQWVQGTGQDSGLPDARAQAGFVSVNGYLYTLRGSGTDQIQNLDRWSNIGEPGIWLFNVGEFDDNGNILLPDLIEDDRNISDLLNTCSYRGTTVCHSKGQCIDYSTGFCCICSEGFYGNGINCLKEGTPVRMNGKISGFINNIELETLDMQSYIVTPDGRTYTAVSHVPELLGYDMQTLNIIGGVIGWLFARPVNNAQNGYQLTGGVFNHTADVNFPSSGHKVTLRQNFLGLDVFDQLKVESDIRGSIPTIPLDSKLNVNEYEIEYRKTRPGRIVSSSFHSYQIEGNPLETQFVIDQTVEYDECINAPPNFSTFLLKVNRNFISYEVKEKIIRYGMTNKVTLRDSNDDPCKNVECGQHSTCIAADDDHRCVCNSGYQFLYLSGSNGTEHTECVDINECTSGIHTCSVNAQCINNPGSFTCRCNVGFSGDGHNCEKLFGCDDLKCHIEAECVEAESGNYQCQCLPGFTGNGNFCTPVGQVSCSVANNCSPYGVCAFDENSNSYNCICLPGYYGDGYSCVDETLLNTSVPAEPSPTCILGVCLCPETYDLRDGSCIRKLDNEKFELMNLPQLVCFDGICVCPKGYQRSDEYCIPKQGANPESHGTMGGASEKLSCNIINTCHPYAQCVFQPEFGQYQCQCNSGYEGDGYDCNEIDISCVEANICDIQATCVHDEPSSRYICRCNPGFQGDGILCTPTDECTRHEDCGDNAQCLWSSQEVQNVCICNEGFTRNGNFCHRKQSTDCEQECHYNARCIFDSTSNAHQCRCSAGFSGDGLNCIEEPVGCHVLNNCGAGADCIYDQDAAAYRCRCRQGLKGDGFLCVPETSCQQDSTLCSLNGKCVLRFTGYYECQCNDGFKGNGIHCKRISKFDGNFLLVNRGMATLKVPFKANRNNPGNLISYQYFQVAVGIDIDCDEGRVYWSDMTGKSIRSLKYDGSGVSTFLSIDIGSPEGLSIDSVSRNIYWTDSTKDTIEVANLDTKQRKVLISTGLVNPRGIAVHPERGKIFWSDWNRENPKLEWANMDGTGRQIFLDGTSVKLPNSLSIDFERDELCWADAGTKTIECIGISSNIRRTVVSNCSYPFGITMSDDNYYWTDWDTQKIENARRPHGKINEPLEVPLVGSGKLYGIVVVPEHCNRLSNACASGGNCGEWRLCLPNGRGGRTCSCGDEGGYEGSGEVTTCNDIL